jgi:hypothetical protein
MPTFPRIDIAGKNYSELLTGNVVSSIGDNNNTSNFTANYKNYQGQYSGCWIVGDEVVITIGSEYPIGEMDSAWLMNGDLSNRSIAQLGSSNLIFWCDFSQNIENKQVAERTTPYPQPIAWYKLDGNALDSTINARHGTPVNGAFVSGKGSNRCFITASGATDTINIPLTVMSGLNNFTYCSWQKLDFNSDYHTILEGPTSTGSIGIQVLYKCAGSVYSIRLGSVGAKVTSDFISTKPFDQKWHHLAVIRSGNQLNVLEDGYSIGTSGNSLDALSISGLHIGQSVAGATVGSPYAADWSLYGKLSDVRIYDKALPSTDIYDIFLRGAKDGYVGSIAEAKWFTCLGTQDSGYNKVAFNLISGAALGAGLNGGSCIVVTGSPQHCNIIDSGLSYPLTPSGTSARSIFAWVTTSTIAAGGAVVMDLGSSIAGASGNQFYLSRGTATLAGGGGAANDLSYASAFVSGPWYHIGLVDAGSFAWLYYNGSVVASGASNWNFVKPTSVTIGIDNTHGTSYWSGKIQDVRVFNRTVSPAEVGSLYNAGSILSTSLYNIYAGNYYGDGKIGYSASGASIWSNTSFSSDKIDFDKTDTFSISVWIKMRAITSVTSYSSAPIITTMTTNKKIGYEIGISNIGTINQNVYFNLSSTWATNIAGATYNTTNINDGNWHNIIATYDGGTKNIGLRVYQDGALLQFTSVYDTLSATIKGGNQMQVLSRDTENYFDGQINDLRIYNIELTPEQVRELYQETSKTGYFYGK